METTIRIITRILGFPFFVGIAIIGSLMLFTKWIINYIRFGGESIAYSQKTQRKTIQDVFEKLSEIQNKQTL